MTRRRARTNQENPMNPTTTPPADDPTPVEDTPASDGQPAPEVVEAPVEDTPAEPEPATATDGGVWDELQDRANARRAAHAQAQQAAADQHTGADPEA